MRYENLNLSANDAVVLEEVLIKAFNEARVANGREADILRAMLYRVRKTGLLDKVEAPAPKRTLLSSPPRRS